MGVRFAPGARINQSVRATRPFIGKAQMRSPIKSFVLLTSVLACLSAADKVDKNAKTADRVETPSASKNYIIGAEDVLLIRVWREPDLSGPVPVRPDGKISILLANEIVASGLTADKLAANIAQA